MHRFEVWAPLPKKVAVSVNGALRPMQGPDEQGWWRLEVDEAGAGTDYGYLIDDDEKTLSRPAIGVAAGWRARPVAPV